MKPLDGAKLKIVWAQKHLDCLKAEIGTYLAEKPYKVDAYRDGDIIRIGRTIITREPPLDFGCIFGDCLNNLRASLDYIAWECARKHTPPATLIRQGNAIHFPIHKSASDFESNGGSKLKNLLSFPASVIDEIERIQPYHAGNEPLGVLSELVKTDKHRLPLLTIATEETESISIMEDGNTFTVYFSDTPFPDSPIATPIDPDSPDAIAARKLLEKALSKASSPGDTAQPADVNVDGQVKVFISLKDFPMPNEPIDVTLTNIFKCVSDIIPRFEPFLS